MISKEEVKKISQLARLGVGDQEAEEYQRELSSIFEYMEKLKSVPDFKSYEPQAKNKAREDAPSQRTDKEGEDLLALAPEKQGRFLKVKTILK